LLKIGAAHQSNPNISADKFLGISQLERPMADESYSPKRDSEECQVWCLSCNAYLYSVSVYEPIARGQIEDARIG
jgi:hypothetical protein